MQTRKDKLTSFNNFPQCESNVFRPERYHDLYTFHKPVISRGKGNSYGDCALNAAGNIINTERLNRFIHFDDQQGILIAEAGLTIKDILTIIVPRGWFLPVVPGTQQVTLGGCVASDIHGKNHLIRGAFSKHIHWIELITAQREAIRCSREQNSTLFWATVGGLGLTGIIGAISIQLIPIETAYMATDHTAANNLTEILSHFKPNQENSEYKVAWIDGFAANESLGRGIIMRAEHAHKQNLDSHHLSKNPPRVKKGFTIPFECPSWLLNQHLLRRYNNLYFKQQSKKQAHLASYIDYFFPLDHLNNWNKLYGPQGFLQYQFVLPEEVAERGISFILTTMHQAQIFPYLCVLKQFGAHEQGPLSFASPGITLAMDIPLKNPALFALLDQFDTYLVEQGGKVYLTKDARMKPHIFRAMYPRFNEWLDCKKTIDPLEFFSSGLSRRLQITADTTNL